MRRACPTCLRSVDDDEDGDSITCDEHGRLRVWLVVDDEGAGQVVAAGRVAGRQESGWLWLDRDMLGLVASWLSERSEIADEGSPEVEVVRVVAGQGAASAVHRGERSRVSAGGAPSGHGRRCPPFVRVLSVNSVELGVAQ